MLFGHPKPSHASAQRCSSGMSPVDGRQEPLSWPDLLQHAQRTGICALRPQCERQNLIVVQFSQTFKTATEAFPIKTAKTRKKSRNLPQHQTGNSLLFLFTPSGNTSAGTRSACSTSAFSSRSLSSGGSAGGGKGTSCICEFSFSPGTEKRQQTRDSSIVQSPYYSLNVTYEIYR